MNFNSIHVDKFLNNIHLRYIHDFTDFETEDEINMMLDYYNKFGEYYIQREIELLLL